MLIIDYKKDFLKKVGKIKNKDIKEKIEDTADTIEILEDEILMAKIRQSLRDIEEGRTIPSSIVKTLRKRSYQTPCFLTR